MTIEGCIPSNIRAAKDFYESVLSERCERCYMFNHKKWLDCEENHTSIEYDGVRFITSCLSNAEIANIQNLLNNER